MDGYGSAYLQTFDGADDDGKQAKMVFKSCSYVSIYANKNGDYTDSTNYVGFGTGDSNTTHGMIDMNTASNFGIYSSTDYNLELKSQGTGIIKLNSADTGTGNGIQFLKAGTKFGGFTAHHTYSEMRLYENEGASTSDFLSLQCWEHGASKIQTIDTAGAAAHLTLDVDGDITLDAHGKQINFAFNGTNLVLFDMNAEEFRIMNSSNQNDYFNIVVGTEGATAISTVDADTDVAHLTLSPNGDVVLTPSSRSVKMQAADKLYFDGGTHTYITELEDDLLNFRVGGTDLLAIAESATTSAAQSSKLYTGCPIYLKDIGGVSDTPNSGYGSLYVNSDVLYFKTDGGTVTNLLSGGGGGTSRWSRSIGGYKTNNNSSSAYYMNYYNGFYGWTASDSSPTSLSYSNGSRCGVFHAPADGTLTNIRISLYALDTGLTDPLKFYVYKGTISDGGSSVSTTLIGTSDTITPVALDTMFESKDFSSSNSFSEGDTLYVMLKKDSTSGNQDVYFSVTISGEYD